VGRRFGEQIRACGIGNRASLTAAWYATLGDLAPAEFTIIRPVFGIFWTFPRNVRTGGKSGNGRKKGRRGGPRFVAAAARTKPGSRAEVAEYPVLLGGPKPRMKVYPQYTVVAEKFAAAVELGMANSRLKDYFDLWALSGHFAFNLDLLAMAIRRTFMRNKLALSVEWPIGLRDEFATDALKLSQWNAFLRKTQPQARPESLADAVGRIRLFLSPVVTGESRTGLVWSPRSKQWEMP
jgi:hypothetical protein